MSKDDSEVLGFWAKMFFIFAGGCALYMLITIASEDAISRYCVLPSSGYDEGVYSESS